MPTTTTASSPPLRQRVRRPLLPLPKTVEGITLALAAMLALPAAAPPAPSPPRPSVMLMTGLPLIWGEKGPFHPASRPAAAYVRLSREFDFRPVDVLDAETLARGRLLFLAQPQRLAPAELAALDAWIRRGGRALILTDPVLTWPSELPPGDIRRPPAVGLLAPLLNHWRLILDPPVRRGQVEAVWNGRRIAMDSPGRLRSSSPDCSIEPGGWTAICRLGLGAVRVVADADLLRDSLWAPAGPGPPAADNPAVVGEWLDALAGTPRPRPRETADASRARSLAAPALLIAAAAGATGLLLRRRRRR